jgi:DedD protein
MSETVDTLKQRVVGAFVIISLAVIFLPMIFDEPRVTQSNIIMPVPPRPDFKVIEIEMPKAPQFEELVVDQETNKVIVKQEQFTSSAGLTDENSKETAAKTSSRTDIQEQPVADSSASSDVTSAPAAKILNHSPAVAHLPVFKNVWMVQLGTFSQRDNAFSLRDQLRKDGFDGHTKEVDLGGKPAIRVFTGPFVDKKEAEKIKLKVDKKYKLVSQVIFFDA